MTLLIAHKIILHLCRKDGSSLTKRRFVCGPSARIRTKNEERQGRPRNNIKTRLFPHWLYFNSPKDTQKPQPEDRENFVLECGTDEVFCIIFVNNELDSFKIGNKRRRYVGTPFEYSEKFSINPRSSKFAFFYTHNPIFIIFRDRKDHFGTEQKTLEYEMFHRHGYKGQ